MEIPKSSSNAEVLKTVRQRCLEMSSLLFGSCVCLSLPPVVTLQVLYLCNKNRAPQEHADISLKQNQPKVLCFFFFKYTCL